MKDFAAVRVCPMGSNPGSVVLSTSSCAGLFLALRYHTTRVTEVLADYRGSTLRSYRVGFCTTVKQRGVRFDKTRLSLAVVLSGCFIIIRHYSLPSASNAAAYC